MATDHMHPRVETPPMGAVALLALALLPTLLAPRVSSPPMMGPPTFSSCSGGSWAAMASGPSTGKFLDPSGNC